MKRIIENRAGKDGRLGVGCSATIFDTTKQKILLIRRADNGNWDVPGGHMEPGENFREACTREVFEETGLSVEVESLAGVYTSPHLLLEYPDGNKWQLVVLHFITRITGGELTPNEEATEILYFSQKEIEELEMSPLGRQRAQDGFTFKNQARICDDFVTNAN